jgi:Flp pilus assembly protein TadD
MAASPPRLPWPRLRFTRIRSGFALLLIAVPYASAQQTAIDDSYNLGAAYLGEGRFQEALPLLAKATVLSPDSANAWKALGLAHL